jgi:hypothetical protein
MLPDAVVREVREAFEERVRTGDSANAGDIQRAHLRAAKALESLGRAVLGDRPSLYPQRP